MKKILIILFIAAAYLLPIGAQEAGGQIECHIVVNGMFFKFLPMGTEHEPLNIINADGRTIMFQNTDKLTADDIHYAIAKEKVKDADAILATIKNAKNFSTANLEKDEYPGRPTVGDKLKAFSVKDIDGNVYTNQNTLGRPLVLNFWYIGCGPCRKEMPAISKWMDTVTDATYLAVTFNTLDEIKDIIAERGFKFKQIAGDKVLSSIFHPIAYPLTVIIDRKGIVRLLISGTNQQKRDLILNTLIKIDKEQ